MDKLVDVDTAVPQVMYIMHCTAAAAFKNSKRVLLQMFDYVCACVCFSI